MLSNTLKGKKYILTQKNMLLLCGNAKDIFNLIEKNSDIKVNNKIFVNNIGKFVSYYIWIFLCFHFIFPFKYCMIVAIGKNPTESGFIKHPRG